MLGLSVELSILAHSVARRWTVTSAVLLLILFGTFPIRARHVAGQRPETGVRLIENEAQKHNLPIAIELASSFLPLSYYGTPRVVARIHYLASMRESQRYAPGSSAETTILGLRPWTTLNIDDYECFVSSYKRFYVYTESPRDG